MLSLYRTPIVLGSSPGARVCFVEVRTPYTETVEFPDKSPITVTTHPRQTWPAIENADDPDKMPAGEYELVMTRMWKSKRPALWKEGTELFLHSLAKGNALLTADRLAYRGLPSHLKGCVMPGVAIDDRGQVAWPDDAMRGVLRALGGFEEKKRIPFRCVEIGELPAVRYEVTELLDDDSTEEEVSYPLRIGERLTRLPNGDVLVEREVK